MLIFGIDTCSMSSSAALMSEEKLIAEFTVNHKKTHSEKIMPQIEAMLAACGIDISDIDAFAASVGPGSFTGVRIGVATAKGFAQVLKKPCVAVSALSALALGARTFEGIICPVLDARRNQVYNALFESDKRALRRITEDRAMALDDLLKELESCGKDVVFTGDGVPVFGDKISAVLGEKAFFVQKSFSFNLASLVCEAAEEKLKRGETVSPDGLVPHYVRLSQAEQEKLKKLKDGAI